MLGAFEKIGRFVARRAAACLAVVGVLTVFFAAGIFRIDIYLGNESFVSSKSKVYQDTITFERHFGGEGVYVLLQGDPERLVSRETARKMAAFTDRALGDVPHITGAVDYVILLRDLLGSDMATAFFSPDNAELARVIEKEIPAEKLQAIRQELMQSLTPEQERQVAAYSQSLLGEEQLAKLAAMLAASGALPMPAYAMPADPSQPTAMPALTPEQQQMAAEADATEQTMPAGAFPPDQPQSMAMPALTPEQQQMILQALTPEQQQMILEAPPETQAEMLMDLLPPEQLQQLYMAAPMPEPSPAGMAAMNPEQLQMLLSSMDREQLQEALAAVLTPEQQEAAAQYAMTLLNEEQIRSMQAAVLQALPPVEEWNSETLRAAVFSDDGKVPEALALLLPENANHVIIQLITAEGLDMADSEEMMAAVEALVAETGLDDGLTVKLAGNHAIYSQIEGEVMGSMAFMLVLSVLLMIAALYLIFPVRRRLVSLAYVLVGLVWTFGFMGWTGIPVSIATMATLPIIIGLGTDFGVQFHNRYEEEYRNSGFHAEQAAARAARHIGPAVGIAVVLMAASFLTMLLSKSPMMQQFGLVLAFGAVVCYAVELALMFATFALADRQGKTANGRRKAISDTKLSGFLYRYSGFVRKAAVPLLIAAVLLAGVGFWSDRKLVTETNMLNMIPQDMEGLVHSRELQDIAGSVTYLQFLVEAEDAADRDVLAWLSAVEERVAGHFAGVEGVRSLASVLGTVGVDVTEAAQADIDRAVGGLPASMLRTLVSEDRRYAALQVQIDPDMPSAEQLALLEEIERTALAANPPAGVAFSPAGTMVLAAVGVDNISANTALIKGLGVAVIVAGLLLIYRRIREPLFTVLPIAFVLGLVPLVLLLLGINYNPLTIALSSLVMGIGTEFTVLVMERYREEREHGADEKDAIRTAISKVGQAITASGLTVIVGFSTLIFVDFPVLREFGITTVIDTTLCLVFALTILPALVFAFGRGGGKTGDPAAAGQAGQTGTA